VAIVILCALIVVETLNAPGTRSAGRRIWTAGSATLEFLGAALATSSFWLIRNYAQLGNPFYPWHLPVFNLVGWVKPPDLADALYTEAQFWWVRSEPGWLAYPWIEGLGPEHQFGSQTGLGLFFAAAVPIACLASLLGVMRGRGRERQTLAFLLGSGLLLLLGWWAGPHQPRYALGALVCLVPLTAWTLTHTRGRYRLALECLAGVAICGMALVFFSVNLVATGRSLAPTRHLPSRRAANRYPGALDRLPPGSTVMNLGQRAWNYALFGEDHRNRVVPYEQAIRTMSSVSPPCYYPIFGVCEKSDIVLDPNILRRLGVTHVFTLTPIDGIPVRGCWHVHEVDRLDDGVMKRSLYLYQITYCDDARGS
jgi:hypothetical protein